MITKPLLILAFNRPTHVKRLIDSLRPHAPQKILVGVDGPRITNILDQKKISQVLDEIKKIDWTIDVELRIRKENLGLRFAVADAVSWAINKYGEVIVIEDDVEVGPEFLSFMSQMLDEFRDDARVGHISGYNLVPENILEHPYQQIRFSEIPESYAWATWSRAWKLYDPHFTWAKRQSLTDLRQRLRSLLSAIIWKINFNDARLESINTWAYRWVATLWANNLLCVTPNRNLITYTGNDSGTHTRTKPNWSELKISKISHLSLSNVTVQDVHADDWVQKNIFGATKIGLVSRILASIALRFLRRKSLSK